MIRANFVALLVGLVAVGSAEGAMTFSDSFTGGASSNWYSTLGGPGAANPINFSGNTANFSYGGIGTQDDNRRYLRTLSDDYHLNDFTASVTLVSNSHHVFFGLGSGDSVTGNFGEPRGTGLKYIYLRFNGTGNATIVRGNGGSPTEQGIGGGPLGGVGSGPYTFEMDWNATAKSMIFKITGSNGQYTSSAYDLSAYDLTGFGRLFIGSGNGTFDNFSVNTIPEPASASVVGMSLLGLAACGLRKKRSL